MGLNYSSLVRTEHFHRILHAGKGSVRFGMHASGVRLTSPTVLSHYWLVAA